MIYVLYNKTAGAHYGVDKIKEKMNEVFPGEDVHLESVVEVENKQKYLDGLTEGDRFVLVGGDGTLNHLINEIEDKDYPFPLYCYAAGTGNDFINDVVGCKKNDQIVQINDYIHDLPTVEVQGKTYKFINGIGYGIDGYCCEEGDRQREKSGGKSPNYTKIALKGLFGAFSPVNATVTVDGVTKKYENVWMVPAMNGRYFGGGMKVTPGQDRLDPEKNLSFAIVHEKSRMKVLFVFPKIKKGTHVKHTKMITILKGKEIHVEFDKPTALQVDGETILAVTSYTARSAALEPAEAK